MSDDKLSTNGMIAPEDLYYALGATGNIRVLDATYSLPRAGVSPHDAFLSRHIGGAQFFDIDAVADKSAPLPHTLPSAEYFASCLSALGISNGDHVVVYDQSGAYMASSRVWWMFRVFGHDNVYVLDGGLDAWVRAGYPVGSGPVKEPMPSIYIAGYRPELVARAPDLLANIETQSMRVVDARAPERFDGRMAEPWAGKRAGHIPNSCNLPFNTLLNPDRTMKDNEELEGAFAALSLRTEDSIAVSCGSGVTACTVALALFKARGQECAVYDGSWSEWGDESSGLPVEVSA